MSVLEQCRPGRRAWAWLVLSALACLVWPGTPRAVPRVVASIAPVHSLAAAVMGDLGTPVQIVRGYGSPHAYQMRPSDAANLRDADLVLWIGPSLETFLQRPLEALRDETTVIALSALTGLRLLPNRSGGVLNTDDHSHGHDGFDAHIWLKPFNAKVMAAAMAEELAALDPQNSEVYRENANRLSQRIDGMEAAITSRLTPVRSTPFVVFHDAFQYFEENFGLNVVGSVTVSPDRMPSARRIEALRKLMDESGVRCVFREPRFESALVQVLLEDSNARPGVIDPLGSDIAPGSNAYIALMHAISEALVACLGP